MSPTPNRTCLLSYVIKVADGEKTKNEENKYEEISIFKDGVTL